MTINYWNNRRSRRARENPKPPESRFKLFFWLIKEHFWDLCALNFFTLLHSIGIITVFPAISALNRVIYNMIDDRPQILWESYRKYFKAELKRSILIGLPLIPAAALLLRLGGFFRESITADWLSTVCIFGLCFTFSAAAYLFSMIPYVALKPSEYYRNAVMLMVLCLVRNLFLILFVFLFSFLIFVLSPLSLPFAFFLAIPVIGYTTAFCTYAGVKKYVAVADAQSDDEKNDLP